jgi:acyl-CoA synthetase (AMP-forming)/AMP-acid ligase II
VARDLAAYKVPQEVVFVDDFPRTATGKLDRRALRSDDGAASVPHP